VIFAYVDESGDPGTNGSHTYALGCVMVDHDDWLNRFDRLIGYRRHIRKLFGIPVRAELKANYLIRNRGPHFSHNPLSERARYAVYRQTMRLQNKLDLKCFAVVIDKAKAAERYPGRPPQEIAWEWLLQRLERRSHYESDHVLLVHDEGDQATIRKLARKTRRVGTAGSAFGTGTLSVPFERLIDDPVPRDSTQSYFLQLADLCAYAAFRRLNPPPQKPRLIVPQGTWDELGAARFTAVNSGASPLAIVHN
jgi:hypothetical protein